MLRHLLSLIFNRYVFIAIGLIALALAIWYLGPLFAFATWRPLGSVTARVWLMLIIALLLLLRLTLGIWRKHQVNARLVDAALGLRERRKGAVPEDPAQAALDEMRGKFAHAVAQLKHARFGSQGDGWWVRLRQRYVYQLPWYVFIGAPGSGKTTALVNSGLHFPLADELGGKESIRGVGGTRSCDWWFTDAAVLLDTAGRFTTQESDAVADKAEWDGFLQLLRKFRPRQPLNGAILTISVQDLLTASEEDRKVHAARLRARLNELSSNLRINFPIYVLVTKMDLLGGFNEFFGNFNKEDRAQVWGATLPLQAESATPGEVPDARLTTELEALGRRLFDKLPDVMLNMHDTGARARAYTLPQHFANLTPKVQQLVHDVFADSRFAPSVMLRGVYFTSGTQEGSPFDRLLSSLHEGLGFDASVAINPAPGRGKSYFLQDLLRKVVFSEAHLAGRNQRAERRHRLLTTAGHMSIVAALALVLFGWTVSYGNNTDYLAFVGKKTSLIADHLKKQGAADTGVLANMLPTLNVMEHLADGQTFQVATPPLGNTFGLYQGSKLEAAANQTYDRALHAVMLPRIARRIEEILRSTPNDDLELNYEALKVYLMLSDPEHYDAGEVESFIQQDWDQRLQQSMDNDQRARLNSHLHNLLASNAVVSPFPLDQALVQRKREQLAGYSQAQRAYSRLLRRLLDDPQLREFTVAEAGGPQAAQVFARASGKPLTQGIAGLFTRDGYYDVFLPKARNVLAMMENEDVWVLGKIAQPSGEQLAALADGTRLRALQSLYLHEYVRRWDEYLGDVRIANTPSIAQSVEVARILAAPDSPIAQFLRAIARETTLIAKGNNQSDASLFAYAKRRVVSTKNDIERTIGPLAMPGGTGGSQPLERIVDDHFEPIRRLVSSSSGAVPLDKVLQTFNEVYMTLSGVEASLGTRTLDLTSTDALARVHAQAGQLPTPLREVLDGLADSGGEQAVGGVRRTLGGELDSSVGDFCRRAIRGRYPFNRRSAQDVTAADFARLFASGGLLDQFFNTRLAAMTDRSGRNWMLRLPSGAQLPLTAFQKGASIRNAFFPSGGNTIDLSFKFSVIKLDASVDQLSLDIDGQSFHYAHGPQVPQQVSWPGPHGSNQVRLTLSTHSGEDKYLVTSGPWALFRLFDAGKVKRGKGPEQFTVSLLIQGKVVELAVTTSSVLNPFLLPELTNYSCPARL